MNKEYIITVFSENKVGLLSQITTVFTCREYQYRKPDDFGIVYPGHSQIYHSRHHRSRKDRETGQADRKENRCTESLCFHPG